MKKVFTAFTLLIFLLLVLFHPFILNKVMSIENFKKPLDHSATEIAYFAGGCFWCMEPVFDSIDGVLDTTVGYMGGAEETANYQAVTTGQTKHFESIKVLYNNQKVDFNTLLDAFWRSIDPTDGDGQFADKGPQYKTAIFYTSDAQKLLAEESKLALENLQKFKRPIVTDILIVSEFYTAEDYHQDYYKKNSTHYNAYKIGSGRARYLEQTWASDD